MPQVINQAVGDNWVIYHGDSAEVLRGLPDRSVHHSIFSPPFSSLYTYSASDRDLGNVRNREEFFRHFAYVTRELLRVMVPGRIVAMHTQEIQEYGTSASNGRGRYDFPGDCIRHMEDIGFRYRGRVTIGKNPQALRHGTPVLTPHGWKNIEDIAFGDEVIGSDGQPTAVIGVWPQGKRPMYRVTFSDRASVDCDGQHRWAVRTLGNRNAGKDFEVATTGELCTRGVRVTSNVRQASGNRRYEIPVLSVPVEFEPSGPLPIDPYLVGALIGDGHIGQRATVALTTQHEIVQRATLPPGHRMVQRPNSLKGAGSVATYHVTADEWHHNEVLFGLRTLGLQGLRAWEKHVPPQYLFASVEDRRELLRGLLDTDGKLSTKKDSIRFNTVSRRLAEDVAFLVQSLGGLARIRCDTKRPYTYKGELRNGRPLWDVSVALMGDWCPFTLPSKADAWHARTRQFRREIESIELLDEEADCTCITVAAADGLYVTDQCVVTHNSAAIRNHPQELLFATLRRDAAKLCVVQADYLLIFMTPGENPVPIVEPIDEDTWIQWASAVWQDIRETDILPDAGSRDDDDERHLCPLQLPVVERSVRLYSNPGEVVLSPFAGIGSEGVGALRCGRKFVGVELKESYFRVAERFLNDVTRTQNQPTLFDLIPTT